MALAHLLSNGDQNDPRVFAEWTFFHADHHAKMAAQIKSRLGVTIPTTILDPINKDDLKNFLNRHQTLHSQINSLLGLGGQDISWFGIENSKSVSDWLELNFSDHQNWETRLGLPNT